jgi:hypothetical protein
LFYLRSSLVSCAVDHRLLYSIQSINRLLCCMYSRSPTLVQSIIDARLQSILDSFQHTVDNRLFSGKFKRLQIRNSQVQRRAHHQRRSDGGSCLVCGRCRRQAGARAAAPRIISDGGSYLDLSVLIPHRRASGAHVCVIPLLTTYTWHLP